MSTVFAAFDGPGTTDAMAVGGTTVRTGITVGHGSSLVFATILRYYSRMFNLIPTEPDEYKVYADWLEDHGLYCLAVRKGILPLNAEYGDGDGYRHLRFIGDGDGHEVFGHGCASGKEERYYSCGCFSGKGGSVANFSYGWSPCESIGDGKGYGSLQPHTNRTS